jgi:hypothetical protein
MNAPSPATDPATALTLDLRAYLACCEELLVLTTRENQQLTGTDYRPSEFYQQRKDLLPRLDELLIRLREWRQFWDQNGRDRRGRGSEVNNLFQAVQGLIMRILLLDQDNQRALLRRGLVPAGHLPPAAGRPPHFVAGLYRRHSTI